MSFSGRVLLDDTPMCVLAASLFLYPGQAQLQLLFASAFYRSNSASLPGTVYWVYTSAALVHHEQ